MNDPSRLKARRNAMPDLSLTSPDGERVELLKPGRSTVLVLTHNDECEECRRYTEQLNAAAAELGSWTADVRVISPENDPGEAVAAATSISSPGVVVIDQWRDITDTKAAGAQHEFPAVSEVVAWVRYLAIQCPECEGETL